MKSSSSIRREIAADLVEWIVDRLLCDWSTGALYSLYTGEQRRMQRQQTLISHAHTMSKVKGRTISSADHFIGYGKFTECVM